MDNNPEKELSPAEEKRGRGRPSGFRMTEQHRLKIANSNILTYLIEAAQGQREMGATQATIGIALLKKVLPDMTTNEITGNPDEPLVHEIRRTIVRPT